ncbi:hypothetical protein D3C71_1451630 [compost metagenome]
MTKASESAFFFIATVKSTAVTELTFPHLAASELFPDCISTVSAWDCFISACSSFLPCASTSETGVSFGYFSSTDMKLASDASSAPFGMFT